MKISVIGSGYVGIVTALGFADKNFIVNNIDIDENNFEEESQPEKPQDSLIMFETPPKSIVNN